ncbi:MAG TPA: anti-sigma factor [Verrucomicrobiae bacterium]|nr:anti-sigma factor [Verrucomicrobiae bacterium]
MSAHDEMLDNVAAFALGALDAREVSIVLQHMQTCDECQAEYETLRPVVTAVGTTATSDTSPSPLLKARIMKEVHAQGAPARRPSFMLPYALAAACLLLAAGFGAVIVEQNHTIADLAGARRIAFAQGEVLVAPDRLYVTVHGLPLLPAGKVYQTWTLAKGATKMTPSVTFTPDQQGGALVTIPINATTVATAISVEPAGGSLQPTTKPVAIVKLGS